MRLKFQDNSTIEDIYREYLNLPISLIDIPISEIPNVKNLLVIPHSFKETKDDLEDLCLFTRFNGKIMTTNLMGFVGIDDLEISITSRFTPNENKDWFLYYMLMKVMHINVFNMPHGKGDENVIDMLMLLFPRLLNEALSQGLYKEYRRFEYNDACVRGVIDVNRFIREDIPFHGKVAYRTHEFSYDNRVTQLVRHTIEYMMHHAFGHGILNNDIVTRGSVSQIINATPSYNRQKRLAVINENIKLVNHPYFTKYQALQKLCLKILRHEKLSYGKDKKQKIHGILFDGAWLWEEYMAIVLSEQFDHFTPKTAFALFQNTEKDKFQQVIPDYLSKDWQDGEEASASMVADAKYIPLKDTEHLSADRACAVYYKTIMYMYRFNSKTGYLFHPVKQDSNDENHVFTTFQINGRPGCTLTKGGFVIPNADEFSEFLNDMDKREKKYIKGLKIQ